MKFIINLLGLLGSFLLVLGESYIPQIINGDPKSGNVEAIAKPDLRGKPLFRINHTVNASESKLLLLLGRFRAFFMHNFKNFGILFILEINSCLYDTQFVLRHHR